MDSNKLCVDAAAPQAAERLVNDFNGAQKQSVGYFFLMSNYDSFEILINDPQNWSFLFPDGTLSPHEWNNNVTFFFVWFCFNYTALNSPF